MVRSRNLFYSKTGVLTSIPGNAKVNYARDAGHFPPYGRIVPRRTLARFRSSPPPDDTRKSVQKNGRQVIRLSKNRERVKRTKPPERPSSRRRVRRERCLRRKHSYSGAQIDSLRFFGAGNPKAFSKTGRGGRDRRTCPPVRQPVGFFFDRQTAFCYCIRPLFMLQFGRNPARDRAVRKH